MTPARKEKYSIRHGYDAMNRIEEAGELIGELLREQTGSDEAAYNAVNGAFMDFMMEVLEIGHELRDRYNPETVKDWIEPKRDTMFAELQRRGLDQSPDARHAFRKIEAVLSWVDDWQRQRERAATAPVISDHKQITNWNDYTFDCPEGTWTAKLEQKAWGKSANLILCFADAATGSKYRLSVFSNTRYKPRDGSHDFRNDAEPGELFELTTKKTKSGNPDLKSARKLAIDTGNTSTTSEEQTYEVDGLLDDGRVSDTELFTCPTTDEAIQRAQKFADGWKRAVNLYLIPDGPEPDEFICFLEPVAA